MKKLFLTLFVVLSLVACDNNVKNSSESLEIDEENHEINNDKKLGITIEDIVEVESVQTNIDDYSKIKTYESHNGMTIDVINRENTLHFFVYTFKGEEFPSVVITRTNTVPVVNEEAVEILTDIVLSLDEDVYPFVDVIPGVEEEDYLTVGIVFNNERDITELPVFISEIAINDFFFDDDNISFYNESSNRAAYEKLYERVLSYIEENDLKGHDSAYEIIDILQPVQKSMEKVEIQYDDFNNVATIYYQGLTDISSQNHIVPFITTNDNKMNILVGFEKDGWLFADNLHFNIDGEQESFGSFDPDRHTLGGSRIREEYIKTNYDDDLTEMIINANEVRMRFKGDKGNLDYTLTNDDIEALKTIQTFNGVRNDLSNLLYRFDK